MAVRWIQIDPSSIDPSDRDSLPEQPGSGEVVLVALSAEARSDDGAEQALITLARQWARDHGRLVLMDLNLGGGRLHSLLDEPRGQGVADVILFGASVGSVARQPAGEAFLFATAGVPVADGTEVLTSERWGGIVRAFRDAGVTLVLAGALEDPGLEGLAALADLGLLVCGPEEDASALLAPLPGQLLDGGEALVSGAAGSPAGPGWATAETPPPSVESASTSPAEAISEGGDGPMAGGVVDSPRRSSASPVLTSDDRSRGLPRWSVWAGGAIAVVALFWGLGKTGVLPLPFGSGGSGEGETPQFVEGVRESEGSSPSGDAGEGTDPAEGDAAAPTGTPDQAGTSGDPAAAGTGGVEVPMGYSVGLASYESEAEALAVTTDLGTRVSEPQFIAAPVEVNGRVYWRVLAGPVPGIQDAEGLRSTLPPRLGYASGAAWVVHWTPMAFLLAQTPSLSEARATAASLRSRTIPAYVLEGARGWVPGVEGLRRSVLLRRGGSGSGPANPGGRGQRARPGAQNRSSAAMKLTRLRLHGFKSFADRTDVDFHDGITAIVGPNGCGKSNISDAIRWVLGEQKPTAIRGAKMEEAIFQGSVNRRPVSRGAVTMVVSNEDGALPVPFEEVEIGRTVYRDGGSEYSLNRSSCRLRDVHDLCRDTGLGANAYSVIENRMIDAILSDRAEERRSLFEEAAGIGKYKDRRKAATRRLERAELDLERLEDVIVEVESKVRSLARQKGKAERYHQYRARRLAVEVAVVGHQLELLQARLADIDSSLAGKSGQGEGIRAELQTLETEYESLRIRQVDAERARGEAAAALDAVRSDLNRWERDLAVADERASAAKRRLEQIGFDRSSAAEAIATAGAQLKEIGEREGLLEESLTAIRAEGEAHADTAGAVRERLGRARERLEAVEARERDLARRGALLDGDAEAAAAQAEELERRLVRLQEELERASNALSDIESQGDLFNSRQEESGQAEDAAKAGSAAAVEAVERTRRALEAARAEELAAVDRASSVETRLRALKRVQEGREGVEPVILEALAQTGFEVLGTLSDFVEAGSEVAESLESFLGPLARALVVPDRRAAEAARRWFREAWTGGGGLILMPSDSAPAPKGPLPEGVEAIGPGAGWVEALLGGVDVVDDEALTEPSAGDRVRISKTGGSVDPRGVIRVGDPSGSAGVLARREEIRALETEEVRAREVADAARAAREEMRQALQVAEESLERARADLRRSEDEARSATAEAVARSERESRAREHQLELTRQLEGTRAARDRALERSREAREDRAAVAHEETELVGDRDAARAAMAEVQEEWETARAEESRLRVELTRAEGEASRLAERLAEVQARHARARERQSALEVEETELTDQLAEARSVSEAGAEATQDLFRRRDESQGELDRRHASLSEVAEAVATAERRVREARSAEREATDRRHRLELEKQELLGRVGRIEERLEGEWGRPLEVLLSEADPVEGEPEELEEELRDLVVRMERLGPVNMLAVEEHAEESQRLSFLKEQRDDLVGARDDLRKAIREINQTATGLFDETFQAIRTHFREVHFKLFQGGEADLWLADPDDLLESPIEIHACPTGKKTQRIDLLSGGERALTALSLLFAIYLVKPSPFCVLDEVDGPLDENNIGRFIRLLNEFKDRSQFVVITHNPRTIEAADWIYGVTMEEPGVSTVVGVRLAEALEAAGASA